MSSYDVPWTVANDLEFSQLCEEFFYPPSTSTSQPIPHKPTLRSTPTPLTPASKSPHQQLKRTLFQLLSNNVGKSLQKLWKPEYYNHIEISWTWLVMVEKKLPQILQSTTAYLELENLDPEHKNLLSKTVTYYLLTIADKLHSIHVDGDIPKVIYLEWRFPPNEVFDKFWQFYVSNNDDSTVTTCFQNLYEVACQLQHHTERPAFFILISDAIVWLEEEQQRLVETERQRLVEEERQRLVEEERQRLVEEERQRLVEEERQRLAEQEQQELQKQCFSAINAAYVGTVEQLLMKDSVKSNQELLQEMLSQAEKRDATTYGVKKERTSAIVQKIRIAAR